MRILLIFLLLFIVASCSRGDHKRETISQYIHYVWKRQPDEIEIKKMEDIQSITGKDSIDLLIKEYAKGITPQPTLDTILSNIEKDIVYNSNLLAKTKQRIDSLDAFQKKVKSDDGFLKDYAKTVIDLRDFTQQTIDELHMYRNSFKRYSEKPEDVFCYVVSCQYKLRGHSPDTTSKMVTQTFFLTPDTRRIFLVK